MSRLTIAMALASVLEKEAGGGSKRAKKAARRAADVARPGGSLRYEGAAVPAAEAAANAAEAAPAAEPATAKPAPEPAAPQGGRPLRSAADAATARATQMANVDKVRQVRQRSGSVPIITAPSSPKVPSAQEAVRVRLFLEALKKGKVPVDIQQAPAPAIVAPSGPTLPSSGAVVAPSAAAPAAASAAAPAASGFRRGYDSVKAFLQRVPGVKAALRNPTLSGKALANPKVAVPAALATAAAGALGGYGAGKLVPSKSVESDPRMQELGRPVPRVPAAKPAEGWAGLSPAAKAALYLTGGGLATAGAVGAYGWYAERKKREELQKREAMRARLRQLQEEEMPA